MNCWFVPGNSGSGILMLIALAHDQNLQKVICVLSRGCRYFILYTWIALWDLHLRMACHYNDGRNKCSDWSAVEA